MIHDQFSRRRFIKTLAGASFVGSFAPMRSFGATPVTTKKLVVIELSGANDGLNTLIPYANDTYYKLRPKIGVPANKVLKIDEFYGFNPGMTAFRELYNSGQVAIVHGCGYAQPSFSHFTSMAYWHTGVPNGGERYGWLGRLADALDRQKNPHFLVNIDERQSLAVNAHDHMPIVFDDPNRFARKGLFQSRGLLDMDHQMVGQSMQLDFLNQAEASARNASLKIKNAWDQYKTPVDYGINPMGLNKIASMISAGFDTPIYYTGYRHNAFDTHVQQVELHQRQLMYVSDAIAGFLKDLKRIDQDRDVTIIVFSEFGRRAAENTSLGTDHGTANHMYVIGAGVNGGHYGQAPSLSDLDGEGNLRYTTDFRRVYASAIENWFDYKNSKDILYGDFEPFQFWS
jgi:uncharacterized protein (DUF1501 family)